MEEWKEQKTLTYTNQVNPDIPEVMEEEKWNMNKEALGKLAEAAVKDLKNSYEDYENGELFQEGFFDVAKRIFKRFQQFLTRVFMKMKQFIVLQDTFQKVE